MLSPFKELMENIENGLIYVKVGRFSVLRPPPSSQKLLSDLGVDFFRPIPFAESEIYSRQHRFCDPWLFAGWLAEGVLCMISFDFQWIPWVFVDFHGFSLIFHGFRQIWSDIVRYGHILSDFGVDFLRPIPFAESEIYSGQHRFGDPWLFSGWLAEMGVSLDLDAAGSEKWGFRAGNGDLDL